MPAIAKNQESAETKPRMGISAVSVKCLELNRFAHFMDTINDNDDSIYSPFWWMFCAWNKQLFWPYEDQRLQTSCQFL